MRVALINPTPYDLYAPGPRAISAYLKKNGHPTRMILVPGETSKYRFRDNFIYQLPLTMVEDLVELVKDCDVVGMSFMTYMYDVSVQMTRAIKRVYPDKFIFYGGHHPTTLPEQCLNFGDAVCTGEGEEATLELLDLMEAGKDYHGVKNYWFKRDGKIVRNPHRPLIDDLDSLPFVDYDLDDHWVYDAKQVHLVKCTPELLEKNAAYYPDRQQIMRACYKAMITRGCPLKCSYCGVSHTHAMYKGDKVLRRRSAENMVAEMKQVLARYPFYGMFHMQDDVFFSASTEEIVHFAEVYKKEIGLPIRAQMAPTTINETKFKAMIDAGLCFTELGIQTGNARTMALYKRGMTNEHLFKATSIIQKYKDYLNTPDYHFILDNPWEDPMDVVESMRVLWKLEPPYNLLPSSLILFPGTEFYYRAKAEGVIKDEFREVYRKHFTTPVGRYINFIFFLSIFNSFPKGVLEFLTREPIVRALDRPEYNKVFEMAYRAGEVGRKVGRVAEYGVKGKLFNMQNLRNLNKIASYWK
ncbi:B12-binding domain-containing radical SAM protein [Myxococcota bacterium]|nr:B12-binding domain-containing radical SAM protein [Myxococcota bacterium]